MLAIYKILAIKALSELFQYWIGLGLIDYDSNRLTKQKTVTRGVNIKY